MKLGGKDALLSGAWINVFYIYSLDPVTESPKLLIFETSKFYVI